MNVFGDLSVTTSPHADEIKLSYDPRSDSMVVAAPKSRFIAHIPFDWIRRAAALPGKTVQIALALCFLRGVKKSLTFKVTQEALGVATCSRQAYYQALQHLEAAKLISVERPPGQRATVTLLDFK